VLTAAAVGFPVRRTIPLGTVFVHTVELLLADIHFTGKEEGYSVDESVVIPWEFSVEISDEGPVSSVLFLHRAGLLVSV